MPVSFRHPPTRRPEPRQHAPSPKRSSEQVSLSLYPSTRQRFRKLAQHYGCSRPKLLTTWSMEEAESVTQRSTLQARPVTSRAANERKVHAPITVTARTAERIERVAEQLEVSKSELVERWVRYEARVAGVK